MIRSNFLRRCGWFLLGTCTLATAAGLSALLLSGTGAASLLFDALVHMSLALTLVLFGGTVGGVLLHEAARLDRAAVARARVQAALARRAQQPKGMHKPVAR